MKKKRITLAIAILSTVVTGLLALEGALPPAWAALAAALGAGGYAIARALQKLQDGADWKSMLSTTEAWGAGLAIVATIVAAVAGVLPPEKAISVVGVAAGLLKLARVLQAKLPGAPAPKRDDEKGAVGTISVFVWLAVVAAIVAAMSSSARAGEFGGCFDGGAFCAGPSATITVGEFNLATQKLSGGVSPGIGYGITWQPYRWYATGLAGYIAFSVGGAQPNSVRPSIMLSFANYVRVGVGLAVTERDVGTLKQWSLLFGLGSDFGGSPTYLRDNWRIQ